MGLGITRKDGEEVTLTNQVTGEVLAVITMRFAKNGSARLHFEAPDHVKIHRGPDVAVCRPLPDRR